MAKKRSTRSKRAKRKVQKKSSRRLEAGFSWELSSLIDMFLGDVLPPEIESLDKRKEEIPFIERLMRHIDELFVAMPDFVPDSIDRHVVMRQLFSDGMVVGQVDDRDNRYNVFVGPFDEPQRIGCDCHVSDGWQPCEHIDQFLDYLSTEFYRPSSLLAKRASNETFDVDSKKPSYESFRFNPERRAKRTIEKLTQIICGARFERALPIDELPPVNEMAATRIIWDVQIDDNTLAVLPRQQRRKKNGKGWSKGRRLGLDAFLHMKEGLSRVDREIRDIIEINNYGYGYSSLKLKPLDAIHLLVGHPLVSIDGQPAKITTISPSIAIRVNEDNQTCCFELDWEGRTDERHQVFLDSERVVVFSLDSKQIHVYSLIPGQSEILKGFLDASPVPKQSFDQLVSLLDQIKDKVPVRLPSKRDYELVEDDFRLVFLLRSLPDGRLDYGIRVRDALGHLHLPGQGLSVVYGKLKKKSVQLTRSLESEMARLAEVTQQLGLPDVRTLEQNKFLGWLSDFDQIMNMIEQLERLESKGVETLWDRETVDPIRVLGTVTAKNVRVKVSSNRDWFQLSGECELENGTLKLNELLESLTPNDGSGSEELGNYVRLGNRGWARISDGLRKRLQKLGDAINQERGKFKFDATAAPAVREFLDDPQIEIDVARKWNQCLKQLETAEQLDPQVPETLNATLREYQVEGYRWMRRLAEWGVGGILADDMGLGKTIQTLAVILDRAKQGPSLVIAPTSVGFNWIRECETFAPDLMPHLYRNTDRNEFLKRVGPGDLVVCSYGLALRDAERLGSVEWSSMVLDEAQAIKNSRSKTALAIAKFKANWKIGLTGTPIENHLGELWSLFRVISPGLLGSWERFRKQYAAPIEKFQDDQRRLALRARLHPFMLRRTKSQVLKELPARTETNLEIELSAEERNRYDATRLSVLQDVDKITQMTDVKDQRFRILALLTRLRQLACSPRLIDPQWTKRSSKLQCLCDTIHELREEGHRVLVFSQFVKHLQLIREMLEEEGINYEYLDGATPAKEREKRVDRFQKGQATAFLISLKAGGTGLNLTAADYVIHMDPWWNPAVEDQATDRSHRIGQDKPVMVYRMISKGTIEEEILKLHETKRNLVTGIMEGTAQAGKLSTDELIALLRKEVD